MGGKSRKSGRVSVKLILWLKREQNRRLKKEKNEIERRNPIIKPGQKWI
jgi:hypothetical protein